MDEDVSPASETRIRVVTISREYGSGGEELADRLAKRLGWGVTDRAIVERMARELGIRLEDAEAHDECTDGITSQVLDAMRILRQAYGTMADVLPETILSAKTYHRTGDQIIQAAAARGKMVIVGRASQVLLLNRRDVLHVRIVAPLAHRVANVMKCEGVDRRTAEARIHRKDRERDRYLQRVYHHRIVEALLYDLVLNTSRLNLDSAVDIICFTLHQVAIERT